MQQVKRVYGVIRDWRMEAQVVVLRQSGLTYAAIGERLGIKRQQAWFVFNRWEREQEEQAAEPQGSAG